MRHAGGSIDWRPAWMAGLVVGLVACGSPAPFFDGTPGQTRPISVVGSVPLVNVQVGLPTGNATGPLILDTGSPLSLLSEQSFAGAPRGLGHFDIALFEMTFPGWQIGVVSLFGDSRCDRPAPAGVIGVDISGRFALQIDYRERTGALHLSGDGRLEDNTQSIPVTVAGGGRVTLDDLDQTVRVGPTRSLLTVDVEGTSRTALLDTGASLVVLRRTILPAERNSTCCLAVSTAGGIRSAELVTIRSLSIGRSELQNVAAIQLPNDELFTALSAETGREVDVILGGNALQHFELLLDLTRSRLDLSRYASTPHIDPNEWLLPGFTVCRDRETGFALVTDVFQPSDAYLAGVRIGDRIEAIDGQPLGVDLAHILAALRAPGAGASVRIQFREHGELDLPLRDWLADAL